MRQAGCLTIAPIMPKPRYLDKLPIACTSGSLVVRLPTPKYPSLQFCLGSTRRYHMFVFEIVDIDVFADYVWLCNVEE